MIEHDSKVAIIGDMLELGEESFKEHQAIVTFIESKNIICYSVGNLFKAIPSSKIVQQFTNCEEAAIYFTQHPLKQKLILLKGSRGIGLERLEKVMN
jgi:UDP-N-acetylmuramoyl-tripeptide--D-alanyl-D-alanine ligase